MLPYEIAFVVLSLNAFLNRKSTKYVSLFVFALFVLFYALRNNVGSDWSQYEFYFNNVYNEYLIERFNFETGYWLLNYLTSNLLGSYRLLVFAVGIFIGIIYWKATNRYTKNIGIVMLLSLFYLFYPTLEVFRQSITLFLFYYSLQYIETNKKKYIFLNVIGLLFHRSGIFGLLFLIFHKYKTPKVIIVIALLLFGVLEPFIFNVISVFPEFSMKYLFYFHTTEVTSTILSLKTVEYLLILIGYFILSRKKRINESDKIWMNLIFLGFIIQITLGQLSNIAYRMTYYTDIGVIFTYSLIYDKLKEPVFKYFYILTLIGYVLLRFWRVFPFDNPSFMYQL